MSDTENKQLTNGTVNGNDVGSGGEDDGGGEFILIGKKHHQRGTKTRMKHHGGNGGGNGPKGNKLPLSSLPYHPSNIRRQQQLLEQQQRDQANGNNNTKVNGNNNIANSKDKDSESVNSVTSSHSSSTTSPNATTWASVLASSLAEAFPSTSSSPSAPSSTLSVASGPTSNSGDDASSTTGNVNNENEHEHENDLQPELEEIPKPKFVEAPPPTVNPWKTFNAASRLKKTGSVEKESDNKSTASSVRSSSGLSATTTSSSAGRGTSYASAYNAPKSPVISNGDEWPSIKQAISAKSGSSSNNGNNRQVSRSNKSTQAPTPADGMVCYWSTVPLAQTDETDSNCLLTSKDLKDGGSEGEVVVPDNTTAEEWPSISQALTKTGSLQNGNSNSTGSRPQSSHGPSPPPQLSTAQSKPSTPGKTGSKQKWLPLALPEPEVGKGSPKRKDKERAERTDKEKSPNPRDYETSDTSTRGRFFRGRGRGGGGRGTLRGRPSSANGYYKEHNGFHATNKAADYAEYSTDYTTLLPATAYTAPEFIMPYVAPTCRVAQVGVPPDITELNYFMPNIVDRSGLVALVKQQIEYYFSEENLEKDFYFRRQMDPDGYVSVTLIASFQRIKNMTGDMSVIIEAIQASPNLELQSANSVRTRKEPGKWPVLDSAQYSNLMPITAFSSASLPANH